MKTFVMTCPVCEQWQIDDVAVAGDPQAAVEVLCKHMRYCAAERSPSRLLSPAYAYQKDAG